MHDFDSPWKDVLDELFEPFMAWFFPTAHGDIDWPRGYESLDKELQQVFPDSNIGRRYIDKLAKVWLRDGAEEWLLIHIEIQTQKESDFERRMFVYNYRLFDRYNRDVVTLVVLSDDNAAWRPCAYRMERWGFSLYMAFPTVKLLDYANRANELATSPNPFAVIVQAHLEARATASNPERRKSQKMDLVRNLFRRGWLPDRIRAVFRFIDWILILPDALKRQFRQDVLALKEHKSMPYISDLEEYLLDQGFQKGLKKGHEEGRLEGYKTANQEVWLAAIELRLRARFPEHAEETLATLKTWEDTHRLRTFFQAIDAVTAYEELQQQFFG